MTSDQSSADDLYDNTDSKLRYEAYSRLQAAAVAFGETLPIPEIVAIGGQSDGKSSLLEAFLGFRFNIKEVEMGTRRPLIVQMVHDASATAPRCMLQEEDSDTYGPPIPESEIADAIKDRTQKHLRAINAQVSGKPIVMRAEFAFCPNLTIIDTPGFILKARNEEGDNTPEQIMEMVKAQASPPHRLILFLQQSSVEWASSLWMHAVQEVDPTFSRTVVVSSKFDNRLKEFTERWEVDRYLSANGYLPSSVRPFFVALPKDRNIASSAEFRSQIQEVDNTVLKHLRRNIAGGFDEEQYGERVGFGNLRMYLEEELARRYRDSAPATLSLLQERCEGVAAEVLAAEAALRSAGDVASLRGAAMRRVSGVAGRVVALLGGCGSSGGAGLSASVDAQLHGRTTAEERAAFLASSARSAPSGNNGSQPQQPWPGVETSAWTLAAGNRQGAGTKREGGCGGGGGAIPSNASLKLYGGAAFERCVEEFQAAVRALEFPAVAKDRVANVLLAQGPRGGGSGAGAAAEGIARDSARRLLAPLLDTACARLAAVLRHIFDIAAEMSAKEAAAAGGVAGGAGDSGDSLRPYVAFHAALRSSYHSFVGRLEERAKGLVRHHLEAATSEFSMGLLLSHTADDSFSFDVAPEQWRLEEFGDGQAGPLGGGQGEEDEEDEENMPPTQEAKPSGGDEREPLRESQMTIPETPSPFPGQLEGAAAQQHLRRHAQRSKSGRGVVFTSPLPGPQAKVSRTAAGKWGSSGRGTCGGSAYEEVCVTAERIFGRIRQAVAYQATPSTLKSAFLEPMREELAGAISMDMFACTDEAFLGMFNAAGAIEALEAKVEALMARSHGLVKCKDEFQELSRCL